MKKERIEEIIGGIDDEYISEAVLLEKSNEEDAEIRVASQEKITKMRRRKTVWILVAAAVLLLVTGGAAFGVLRLEAKEYEKAAAFFEENGLSSEGLTRAELKAVYRDIIMEHFTYGKTAEVFRRSVEGFEIGQAEPTPEELRAVWDRNVWRRTISKRGYSYETEVVDRSDASGQTDTLDKTILRCFRDGTLLWTAEFPSLNVYGYFHMDGGTVVWGTWSASAAQSTHAWVSFVDDSGEKTWRTTTLTSDSRNYEVIAAVVDNGDGSIEVISHYDYKYIALNRFDRNGKVLSVRTIETDNYNVTCAARIESGYLLSMQKWDMDESNLLFKVDEDGNVLDQYSITADDCDYYITDMTEFSGQVYLSCYSVPKQSNENGREEIGNILGMLYERPNREDSWEIPSEELTPMLRENYTAVLFRCDPDGGSPKAFFSVKGSLGGKLSVNGAGYLEWNTESIISSFFSPATSSFTLGGTCKVFQYDFDSAANLVHQEDTGETVPYRR